MAFTKNFTWVPGGDFHYASTSVPALGLWPFAASVVAGIAILNVFDALSRVGFSSSPPTWWNLSQPQPSFRFRPGSPNVTAISAAELLRIRVELRGICPSLRAYNTFSFVDLGGHATYGMLLVSGNATFGSIYELEGLWLTPLTVELGWIPSTFQRRGNIVSSTGTINADDPNFRRVQITHDWIQTINPFFINTNTTLYNYFTNNIICDEGSPYCSGFYSGLDPALLISALLTATLSKMTPEPGQWREYTIPTSGRAVIGVAPPGDDISGYQSTWPVQIYHSGLGYGPDVLAVRLSLAILILYSVIAVSHIFFTVWTGISSSSWDSMTEIVALCIHSRPAAELENTCAGIKATRVLESRVRVAATHGWGDEGKTRHDTEDADATEQSASHLELLFDSGEQATMSAVKLNHEYGASRRR
jgi:hypothetical protein